MIKTHLFIFLSIGVLFTAACGKKNSPAGSGTAGLTAETQVGVPECDEYLAKYQKCVASKVPEASRVQMTSALNQTIQAWKNVAQTPEGREGLAVGCKSALEAAKKSMTSYGCEW